VASEHPADHEEAEEDVAELVILQVLQALGALSQDKVSKLVLRCSVVVAVGEFE
jgi:uncharacterized membrane protein YcjF (UPF0283 family)